MTWPRLLGARRAPGRARDSTGALATLAASSAGIIASPSLIRPVTFSTSLMKRLSREPIHIDEIRARTNLPIEKVIATLAMMELKGLVRQVGGMNFIALREAREEYTVGVLVQTNFGDRQQLRIAGVPVGTEIRDQLPMRGKSSSIIIVIATDAPLLPHQLKRVARRASLGLGRVGSISGDGSGDIFIAFSTVNFKVTKSSGLVKVSMLSNSELDPLFEATVQATEEAIINALVAAETMTGRDGNKVMAIPHDRLRQVLKEYNR